MANWTRAGDPRGFNKGCSSKFCLDSWVRQTPEESWRTYRPKCCGNNNKDEDNSSKTLYDKNHPIFSECCPPDFPLWFSFTPTWPFLIIEFLSTWAKILELSSYHIVINCAFSFHTINVFDCFDRAMAQFELVKECSRIILCVDFCGFQITVSVKQCATC